MYKLVIEINNPIPYIQAKTDVFNEHTRVSVLDNASGKYFHEDGELRTEKTELRFQFSPENQKKLFFSEILARSIFPDTNIRIAIKLPNKTFQNIVWPSHRGDKDVYCDLAEIQEDNPPPEPLPDPSPPEQLLDPSPPERLLDPPPPEPEVPPDPPPEPKSETPVGFLVPLWAYLVAGGLALLTALVIFWAYRFNDSNFYAEKIWSSVNQVINIFTKSEECKLKELLSSRSLTAKEFESTALQVLSNCISTTSKIDVAKEIESLTVDDNGKPKNPWANLIVGHLYFEQFEHPIIEKKLGLVSVDPTDVPIAVEYYKRAKDLGLSEAEEYLDKSCKAIDKHMGEDLLTEGFCD